MDVNIYARRREMMGNVLSDAGYEFQMPKGAFYFFPKAPGGDDVAFVNKLLDERILAVPGSGFGGPGHFRLAFCVEDEVIARSVEGFKAGPRVGKPFRAARQPPFPAEPGKKSTGHSLFMGARWTDSGLPEESFPRPGNQRTFQSHSPKRQRAGRGFPPFFITFQKNTRSPVRPEGYFKGLEATPEPPDGNVFPWGGLLRFPHHERSHSLDTSRSTV